MDEIRSLWSKVRELLCSRCTYFGTEMEELSWPQRKAEILGKGEGTRIMVDVVLDTSSGAKVAYCVSTVDGDSVGEVDSIFVEESYRGQGIGGQLILRAVQWMEGEGASKMQLIVTYGNEEVLAFYEEHGFYPRRIVLERKNGR